VSEPNAASVAILDGDRVLLIQRAYEPLKGLWTLPGGRREPGERIETTAAREVREEVGLIVTGLVPVLLMPVSDRFQLQTFATRGFAGKILASDEVADFRWAELVVAAGLPTTPGLDDVLRRAFALCVTG
jgi:8-oxo-dGTP diphosphatase